MLTKNQITIRGFVGRAPETRQTGTGTPITRFSVATTERWRGKDEQVHEHTEWHRVVFFGPQATQLANFLQKGSFVEVEGRIRTRTYEKDGIGRLSVEVRGADYSLLDRRPGTDEGVPSGTEPPAGEVPADDDLPPI
jgi:single-strand DNA-binding protein